MTCIGGLQNYESSSNRTLRKNNKVCMNSMFQPI